MTTSRLMSFVASVGLASAAAFAVPFAPTARAEDPAPPSAPAGASVEQLIERLGAPGFDERAAASRELQRLGRSAEPALRRALDATKDPEVRWRIEQLLLRLDGTEARPLGGARPESDTRPRAEADGSARRDVEEDAPGKDLGDDFGVEDLGRLMRELEERTKLLRERWLEGWNRPDANGGIGGWPRFDAFGGLGERTIEAQGLVLRSDGFGPVELKVSRPDAPNPADRELTYRGWSLDDVLAKHPDLAQHPGMDELRRKVAAEPVGPGAMLRDMMREHLGQSPGFGIQIHPGISTGTSIVQDANGVKVTIRTRGEDGEIEEKTYQGKSIEELKAAHPELESALSGIRLEWRAPRFFFGPSVGQRDRPRRRGLEPLDPGQPAPMTPGTPTGASFGVIVGPVSESLAAQLKLETGLGAIVHEVVSGSAAERLGVRRFDVLLAVDGEVLHGSGDASVRLRPKADPSQPLDLLVIRGGERVSLKR